MCKMHEESLGIFIITIFDCIGNICSANIPGTSTIGFADGDHLSTAVAQDRTYIKCKVIKVYRATDK